jgi:hypothetical protein
MCDNTYTLNSLAGIITADFLQPVQRDAESTLKPKGDI